MIWFFSKKAEKREVEELKKAVQTGFNNVKQDVNSINSWIKYLNSRDEQMNNKIFELLEEISSLKEEIENLKNIIGIVGESEENEENKQVFKHKQTVFKHVLNSVQTPVQTVFLEKLTPTERAIVFILLNTDMKLSYEDIAAMLGKSKATIRGQINSIKHKSESLIEEIIGENNKKRVFIPKEIKEKLLKSQKVRVKSEKKEEES